ncbi:MAG: RRXRR domain-containing protein, partial [Lachnospiraceae bacterium]|nr:RRXRR domain-containing protein [Lachnospiraceae bacterium]
PTAKHLLNTHLRIVEIMSRYYPIANVAIEINRFDFAKMENPGIRNWEYQKGRLFGFKDRNEAVFHDQNGKCLLCGRRPIEHYHHIMPRGRGSESIDNIAGLCTRCHSLVHTNRNMRAKLRSKKHGMLKKYHALSVINQIMPSLLKELSARYPTYTTTGWQTQQMRAVCGYPKKEPDDGTHYIDAWLIAVDAMGITPTEIPSLKKVVQIRQFRRHDRARVHYQHERSYYLNGTKVCENRHKRTGQTDPRKGKKTYPSLAEYRASHPCDVAKLTVKKSTRGYNDLSRVMPGALVRWNGKLLTVSGKHNARYQFIETDICKEAGASKCTIIMRNRGFAFI